MSPWKGTDLRINSPNNGQLPALRPALFSPGQFNTGEEASPMASDPASLPQAGGSYTIDNTTGHFELSSNPSSTDTDATGINLASGPPTTAGQSQAHEQPDLGLGDFHFQPPQPDPDFSYTDFSALFGPGTWHEGVHEDCSLDAQHRHCPDGGVYFPSAAGAAQMITRARESLDIRDADGLAERIREHTEQLRAFERRLTAGASMGIMQGSGQAVMILDIGQADPLAPGGAFEDVAEEAFDGGDGKC